MKLINKKNTNYNNTTKTINHTILNTTNILKTLHIFPTQTSHFNPETVEFNRSKEIEIETELKRTQARTYASMTPPK